MAMFSHAPQRPDLYRRFVHEVPDWFRDAKFGIFVHWGAYSVPAWAEPIGELGTIDKATWFKHNPYAEWYANTIRIDGSPAQRHHEEQYGGAPYDDFLDQWRAEACDADDMVGAVPAGRRAIRHPDYQAPRRDHALGRAGHRNPQHRPPRAAPGPGGRRSSALARQAGLRFGVYYSGGLDWHASDFPPIQGEDFDRVRPVDETYNAYAFAHVRDLIDRYHPDVLWGDIEWPDAGKPEGAHSFDKLLDAFYAATPDGVVNDRWGLTHWDFRTSEYQQGNSVENTEMWENCRGVGLSFGYNRMEDAAHYMDGPAAVRHLVDVVSRGGNFLLNVGPDAAGRIPALQRSCLNQIGDWMARNSAAVHGTRPVDGDVARPGTSPWVRWTRTGQRHHAVVDASGQVRLDLDPARLAVGSARLLDGTPVPASVRAGAVTVDVPEQQTDGPAVIAFDAVPG